MARPSRDLFYTSAAFLLLLTAAAKLYSAMGNARMLRLSDAFLHINNRALLLAVAVLELATAACLLSKASARMRGLALFWLSGNFVLYRVGSSTIGATYCQCLGTLGQKLPLSQAHLNAILASLVIYWFVGSGYLLWRDAAAREKARIDALELQHGAASS